MNEYHRLHVKNSKYLLQFEIHTHVDLTFQNLPLKLHHVFYDIYRDQISNGEKKNYKN